MRAVCVIIVGVEGLEPSRVASYDFESYAYTNSATRPYSCQYVSYSNIP